MNLASQAAATEKHVGFAAAMYVFMPSLGQCVGVAVGGVVFQSRFAVELGRYPDWAGNASALAQDASGLVQGHQGDAGGCGGEDRDGERVRGRFEGCMGGHGGARICGTCAVSRNKGA